MKNANMPRIARFETKAGDFLGVLIGDNSKVIITESSDHVVLYYEGTKHVLSSDWEIEDVIEELERTSCNSN